MVEDGTVCLTILLVEDYDDSRIVLKRMLEMSGEFCVLEAADGQAALELACKKCPDLILMDLNLPQMDGLMVTKQIRECAEECKDVPVIAITAHDTYGMRDAAREAGCNGYVTKPIDFDELERVIRQTLSSR